MDLLYMNRYLINFKEISYGVCEVFAENETEARELAEGYEGNLMTNKSELELGEVVRVDVVEE